MKLWQFKVRYWTRLWWRITINETLAPLTDTNARLQFLALVVLLYIILPSRGEDALSAQLINSWDALHALLYALPISFVLNGFFAIFKSQKEDRELGQWVGSRFIYHSPRHLATFVVTDADNGKLLPFKIRGLDKGVGIEVRIERDLHDDDNSKLNVQFAFKELPIIWDNYYRPTMLGWLPKDKVLYITTLKPTPSNPSTVKVYLLAWSPNISY